jgi:superfamily I DNA/RNA helicase
MLGAGGGAGRLLEQANADVLMARLIALINSVADYFAFSDEQRDSEKSRVRAMNTDQMKAAISGYESMYGFVSVMTVEREAVKEVMRTRGHIREFFEKHGDPT